MIFFRGNVGPKVSDLTWTIQMFWSYACCFIWLHLVLPLSSEQTQLLSGTTLGNWNPSRLPSLVKQNLKTTGTSIYHLNGQSMFFHAPPPPKWPKIEDKCFFNHKSSSLRPLQPVIQASMHTSPRKHTENLLLRTLKPSKLPCIHHKESNCICWPDNSKGFHEEWNYNIDQGNKEK